MRHLASVAAIAMAVGCANGTAPHHDPAKDRAAIETALRQWPSDFNAENLPATCGLFADDVVLSYPDSPDRGHAAFCDQMRRLFDDPSRTFSYAPPDIREILVDGDLATVRLIWTLTVRDGSGRVLETAEENGLDVFRRQADGSWKIHVSHAFTQD